MGETWKIFWNDGAEDTYLYGSKLSFHKRDDVEFFNDGMPPGTVIKTWYSRTDFQRQHIEPSLPLIDGELSYRLTADIDYDDKALRGGGRCLMRLVFYDRYDKEAGDVTMRDDELVFRCPLRTYSYRLQLVNGGVSRFRFHSVTIRENTDEERQDAEKTV